MGHPGLNAFMPLLYCILSVVIICLLVSRFRDKGRWTVLAFFFSALAVCFFTFKEGFIRHDMHEAVATSGLTAMATLAAPILWTIGGVSLRRRNLFRVLAVLLIGSSIWCLSRTYVAFFEPRRLQTDLVKEFPRIWTRAVDGGRWLCHGDSIFDAQNQAAMALIRQEYPLPSLSGSVDMYGLNQLAILDAGLDYRPRPVTPGYHAWTPGLIEINRASLLGTRAPENILLTPGSIDFRFPTMDDGALWPSLLSGYDIVGLTTTDYAVLRRRSEPRPCAMSLISSGTYRRGEEIPVPATDAGAIWVQIKITPTLFGKIGTMLYRSPSVWLKYKTAAGSEGMDRIIPGMCEDGFVLSPYISDVGGFVALAGRASHLPDLTSIAIVLQDTHNPTWWYEPDIEVTFERLIPPLQDLSAYPALEARANLAELARTNTDQFIALSFFSAPDGKIALFSHPPTHMQLLVPPGKRRLHIGYGIRPEAWDKSQGVIYRVSEIAGDGSVHTLWEKELLPATRNGDRGQFYADVSLPLARLSRIMLQTLPGSGIVYDWAYWSDVRFK